MSKLGEAELIDLIENRYFASVDGKRLDEIMACFAADATLRVETAKIEHVGHDAIRRMFGDFMGTTKTIYHGEYSHVIDVECQLIASQFVARNDYDDGPERLDVGTRWRETRTMFGKSATEEMVVTAIEPGRSYTVEADSKNAHYTSVLAIGALDSGNSRLSMSFGGEPKGLCAKLLAATVGRMFSGATKRALLQDLVDIATAAERG